MSNLESFIDGVRDKHTNSMATRNDSDKINEMYSMISDLISIVATLDYGQSNLQKQITALQSKARTIRDEAFAETVSRQEMDSAYGKALL